MMQASEIPGHGFGHDRKRETHSFRLDPEAGCLIGFTFPFLILITTSAKEEAACPWVRHGDGEQMISGEL